MGKIKEIFKNEFNAKQRRRKFMVSFIIGLGLSLVIIGLLYLLHTQKGLSYNHVLSGFFLACFILSLLSGIENYIDDLSDLGFILSLGISLSLATSMEYGWGAILVFFGIIITSLIAFFFGVRVSALDDNHELE